MARLPRLAIDQQLHHLLYRAAPGQVVFGDEADRKDYLSALAELSRQSEISIHAYCLLPECVHLLLTPRRGADLAPMMQRLGRRFVASYNRRHGCSGSPWEGRYRTSVLQASPFLLEAMRHVEMAAVGAGLVANPEDWPASSAAHHFGRRFDPLITDHPIFWLLGNTPFERELAYRRLCEVPQAASMVERIDEATEKGWAIGDSEFIEELSAQQARRLLPVRRGRRKRPPPEFVSDPN